MTRAFRRQPESSVITLHDAALDAPFPFADGTVTFEVVPTMAAGEREPVGAVTYSPAAAHPQDPPERETER